MGFPGGTNGNKSAFQIQEIQERHSVPGSRRFTGGGYGNPAQYSCLEYPVGRRRMADYSP